MIPCPHCSHPTSRVVDTRSHHRSIRRRRSCDRCGYRFNTHERAAGNIPTDLYPQDQAVLNLLYGRKQEWRVQALMKATGINNRHTLANCVSRLKHYLRPYGYTITPAPYQLKVLRD